MSATKTREFLAAIAAIVIVIVMLAVAAGVFGWNIPILSNLAHSLGIGS